MTAFVRRLASPHRGSPARLTYLLLGAYLLVVLSVSIWRGAFITPDVFFVVAGVGALLTGRGVPFIRDWAPLAFIFLGWEAARNVAYQAGFPVQSDSVIALERMIALGTIPTVDLQRLLYTPGHVGPLDIVLSAIYGAHFILPLAVAFWFWLSERPTFQRYVVTLMAMSFAQFAFALFVPVAPPRFAGQYGAESLPVVDIMGQVATEYHLTSVSWIYRNMIGNPVAAFPSLHAAYPVLAALFLAERHRRASIAMLAYGGVVWFAIVYLGHHYMIDAIAGGLLAVIAYCSARLITRRADNWRGDIDAIEGLGGTGVERPPAALTEAELDETGTARSR